MSLPVLILAGGKATRLGAIAASTPKCLLDVAGQPFLTWQLRLLASQGYRQITLLVGHLGDAVEAAIGDGAAWGVDVSYVEDGAAPRGTGGAVRQALRDEPAFVLYGDAFLRADYRAIEAAWRASGQPALMTVYRNAGAGDVSNVHYAEGMILLYDKAAPTPGMEHIDWGLGVFTPQAFSDAGPDPLDLGTVQASLAEQGRLAAYEVSERFYEIGSAAGLEELRAVMPRFVAELTTTRG